MKNESKKSICFIGTYTYSLFNKNSKSVNVSGVDVQLYNWAREFTRRNHEVSFVVGDFGQDNVETHRGVKIYKANKPRDNGLIQGTINFIKIINLLRTINADVYISRGASGPLPFEVAVYCKLWGKRHVHMICSNYDVDGTYTKNHQVLGFLHMAALHLAHKVIAQTYKQKKLLANKRVKSIVVRNSFSMHSLNMNTNNKSECLWIGSAVAVARPDLFIDIIRRNPDFPFTMVLQPYDNEIYKRVSADAVSLPNLTFVPGCTFDESEEYYWKAKFYIHTADAAGFPNAFIQAMINKTPIVSLSVNPDNFITENNVGVYCHGDMSEINDTIRSLSSNTALYNEMKNNCFFVANRDYNIESNFSILKSVIS